MIGNSFMGVHFGIWAAASAIIAVVYYFVWPKPVNDINSRPLWRHIILRYFHSLVWLLMGISFLLRLAFANASGETIGDVLAMTAFLIYMVFLVVSVLDKRASS